MGRRIRLVFLMAAAAAAILACFRYVMIRDNLQHQRQSIQEKWSYVEETLDHRAAALPALMEATGEFPADSPLSQDLLRARANLAAARGPDRKIRANREVSQVLAKVLLRCDSDRKVRQSAAFRTLRESMSSEDDEIASARFAYNDALEHYNAQLQRFPDNVVALLGGFARNDAYFNTGPELAAPDGTVRP